MERGKNAGDWTAIKKEYNYDVDQIRLRYRRPRSKDSFSYKRFDTFTNDGSTMTLFVAASKKVQWTNPRAILYWLS